MIKVYPRDLFNDANLLKCVGKLSVLDLDERISKNWTLYIPSMYEIVYDDSSGSSSIVGMILYLKRRQKILGFERPLNSREDWPLVVIDKDCSVFSDGGDLSEEFKQLLLKIEKEAELEEKEKIEQRPRTHYKQL